MPVPFNLAASLDASLQAAATAAGLETPFAAEVRGADPRHGDFQANGVLGYAKARKLNPRTVAQQLVAALPAEVTAAYEVTIAGPGFLNFALRAAGLLAWLQAHARAEQLATGAATTRAGESWIVDYSSPNTAKQMHVGHLRSAVIGEAIARLLAYSGAKVTRDNHIGDWGTQFGKLIWAYKRHVDTTALARDPIEEFERLYKLGNSAAETDIAIMDEARAELVQLQTGKPESLEVWRQINEASLRAFQKVYDQLGIRFDLTLGESFYNDKVARIYAELTQLGLAQESLGALVVFHPEHPRFKEQPFIIRKSDGAANYASTDLATILYRTEVLKSTGMLYVVDKRQGDHFEQLFITVRKWFTATHQPVPRLEHVDFGTVLGENNKPLKTRDGENIKLKDLLTEACDRAYTLVCDKNPDLPEAEKRAIAEVVGIGSVQYADLAQNRSSDYLFAWDRMISLEGNTAAYLLYAVARIHSIFRKLGFTPGDPATETAASGLETPTELALARKLVKFPEAIQLAASQMRPHFLCLYLYEVAGEFSAFYSADKVAVDDAPVRARRLLLCARTMLILENGLQLLGLRTLARM